MHLLLHATARERGCSIAIDETLLMHFPDSQFFKKVTDMSAWYLGLAYRVNLCKFGYYYRIAMVVHQKIHNFSYMHGTDNITMCLHENILVYVYE